GVRPEGVIEDVVVGVRPEHRAEPGDESRAVMPAPRQVPVDRIGAPPLASGAVLEVSAEPALPRRQRSDSRGAIGAQLIAVRLQRLAIRARALRVRTLVALWRAQVTQLTLLVGAHLPHLRAADIAGAPRLAEIAPLAGLERAKLLAVLRLELPPLGAVQTLADVRRARRAQLTLQRALRRLSDRRPRAAAEILPAEIAGRDMRHAARRGDTRGMPRCRAARR